MAENEKGKSKTSLAALKAWQTRRAKLGVVFEKEKKDEGKDVEVSQVKAGGIKKKRVIKKSWVRIPRREGVSSEEAVRQYLFGENYRENIMIQKLCEKCWRRRLCFGKEQAELRAKEIVVAV